MRNARRLTLATLACLCLVLAACGYTLRGQEGSTATDSVLGDGSKTLKFLAVEQTTIYPNVPYIVRSVLREEINARGMAVWKDSGTADYGISVDVSRFTVYAYGQSRETNLLYTASIYVEFKVYDGRTNTLVWSSGPVAYSENYSNVNEETAIRQVLLAAIRRGVDRMQNRF